MRDTTGRNADNQTIPSPHFLRAQQETKITTPIQKITIVLKRNAASCMHPKFILTRLKKRLNKIQYSSTVYCIRRTKYKNRKRTKNRRVTFTSLLFSCFISISDELRSSILLSICQRSTRHLRYGSMSSGTLCRTCH